MTETLFVHADTVGATPGPAVTTWPAADVQHYGVKIAAFGDDDNAHHVIALTHNLSRAIAATNRWWRDKTGENAHEITATWAGHWDITRNCDACDAEVTHTCNRWAHPGDWDEQHAWQYEECSPDTYGAWPVVELAVL